MTIVQGISPRSVFYIHLFIGLPLLSSREWRFPGFGFRRHQLQSPDGQDSLWQAENGGDAQQDLRYSSGSDAGHRRGGESHRSFDPFVCVELTEEDNAFKQKSDR